MCGRTLRFFLGGLLVERELVCPFQNLQTGTHFASRLVVFIKRYPVSVSQVSPSALSWTGHLLAVGSPTASVLLAAAPQMPLLPQMQQKQP